MHSWRPTDYIILLSGEITLSRDNKERNLKPFECVTPRGTNHIRVNRSAARRF